MRASLKYKLWRLIPTVLRTILWKHPFRVFYDACEIIACRNTADFPKSLHFKKEAGTWVNQDEELGSVTSGNELLEVLMAKKAALLVLRRLEGVDEFPSAVTRVYLQEKQPGMVNHIQGVYRVDGINRLMSELHCSKDAWSFSDLKPTPADPFLGLTVVDSQLAVMRYMWSTTTTSMGDYPYDGVAGVSQYVVIIRSKILHPLVMSGFCDGGEILQYSFSTGRTATNEVVCSQLSREKLCDVSFAMREIQQELALD